MFLTLLILASFLTYPIASYLTNKQFFLGLSISPLILSALIAGNFSILRVLGNTFNIEIYTLELINRLSVFLIFTLIWIIHLTSIFTKRGISRNISSGRAKNFVYFLISGAIGLLIYFPNLGLNFIPPQDNDAILHVFVLESLKVGPSFYAPLCNFSDNLLSGSPTSFYPCGPHLIGSFLGGIIDFNAIQKLNMLYVFAAIFLGFGAFSYSKLTLGANFFPLVLPATVFFGLIYPYALNGIFAYFFALAFLLPILASIDLVIDKPLVLRQKSTGLILVLGISSFLLHPSIFLFSTIYLVIRLLSKKIDLLRKISFKNYLFIIFVSLVAAAFTIYFDVYQRILTSSQFQVLVINFAELAETNRGNPFDVSFSALLLGNSWTRIQPIFVIFWIYGFCLILRNSRISSIVTITKFSIVFYFIWILISAKTEIGSVLGFIFYGEWYRVLGIFTILAAPAIAYGIRDFINAVTTKFASSMFLRRMVFCIMVIALSLNLATGFRIINQAWSRENSPPETTLQNFKEVSGATQNEFVLNDSENGSAWAFGAASVKVVSPLVGNVAKDWNSARLAFISGKDRDLACAAMYEKGVNIVELSPSTLPDYQSLDLANVHSGFTPETNLYRIDYSELYKCASANGIELNKSPKPEWWQNLNLEDYVLCRKGIKNVS